jgi:thymidylate synthase (FAD)
MENKVELIGCYGSDEIICLSAWTSTSRNLTSEKRERISALINQLWSNGHETPFEKATVHFLVDCDIASHIHLLKHRMASINAESARYKELKEDKYYIPNDFKEVKISKDVLIDGESDFPFSANKYTWYEVLKEFTENSNRLYHECLEDLTPILGRKRAKESARYFKTYNSQIQADVQFNMRSFANFLKLRNSEHAQLEIRIIAEKMLSLVQNIQGNPFKHTLKAWGIKK